MLPADGKGWDEAAAESPGDDVCWLLPYCTPLSLPIYRMRMEELVRDSGTYEETAFSALLSQQQTDSLKRKALSSVYIFALKINCCVPNIGLPYYSTIEPESRLIDDNEKVKSLSAVVNCVKCLCCCLAANII